MAIIQISDIELLPGVSTIASDDIPTYEMLIISVQDLANSICYRTLEETTHISEKHDGDGTDELYLDNYPIRSIEEVKYGSVFGGSERSEIVTGDYLVDSDIGRLTFGFNSIEGINQVFSVRYTAGWTSADPSDGSSNAPDDLKLILSEEVQTRFVSQFIDSNLKSTKMGDAKVEMFSNSDKGGTSSFAQKLFKYIRSDL